MRQLWLTRDGRFEIREVPEPKLFGDGAVVKARVSIFGVGSEFGRVAEWRRTRTGHDVPLGYQLAGEVTETSGRLNGILPGDRVVGVGQGIAFHAEKSFVPKHVLAKIPDSVSDLAAATANVGLTAMNAARRGRIEAGEVAVVLGLGMVGQVMAQYLRVIGCSVVGIEPVEFKRDIAKECGIESFAQAEIVNERLLKETDGHGADVVVICTAGGSDVVRDAVRLVRPSGRIVCVGFAAYDFQGTDAHSKEIDVYFAHGRGPGSRDAEYQLYGKDYPRRFVRWSAHRNLEALMSMMARGAFRLEALITHRFPFERAIEAAELVVNHPNRVLGVALEY